MPSSDTQFKKGHKGQGRPKGSRNKITKKYLESLLEAYDPEVIERLKKDKPEVYIKLYSQLVPKDLDIKQTGDVTVQIVNYQDES